MDTTIIKGGKFTFTLTSTELSRGLRPTKRVARNMEYLVECVGAVGRNDVLSVLDELTRIDTLVLSDPFPFPQIFVFTKMTIVCGMYKIYEWVNSALSLKYTTTEPCGIWSAVDFYDYIYLSNGKISVVRDAGSKVYSISTLPSATTACNYNGQVIIGSPDVDGLGVSLSIPVYDTVVETDIPLM